MFSKIKFLSPLGMIFGPLKESKNIIAVINIRGTISDSSMPGNVSFRSLNKTIELAFDTPRVVAVALSINSPGGSPVQSELIYKRITNLSTQKQIPVYSFIEDCGASGGYKIACAGSKIFCLESSIVGCIGTIMSGFGFQNLISTLGIERRVITHGKHKNFMDPFQELNENDVKTANRVSKAIGKRFINIVKISRNFDAIIDLDEVFSGSFWTGKDAIKLQLVDEINDLNSYIYTHYPESTTEIKEIKEKTSLISSIITTFTNSLSFSLIESLSTKITYTELMKRIGM